MALDMLVRNAAVWGTEGPHDLSIREGGFVAIKRSLPTAVTASHAVEGRMAVPGFVEPHIHLGKALISERAPVNVSGTLTEARPADRRAPP